MTDSFIQLTTDGSGKKLDTVIVNLGVGSTELHREKMIIADPSSSGGYANVTSSQGLQVLATGPVTITSGLVSVTSGTITSTSATNPWSSAPSFNVPMVSASSGLVQISGTATIVSASSGLVQISGTPVVAISSSAFAPVNVVTSSGAYVPVTTGAGLLVQATGPVSISGTVTVLSASSGLVQISGTPTVLSASSGFVQVYQSTTPWAILSASSGLIQALGNVTTSTPEYSAGINLLTLTTAGALRVATTASVSGASTDVNVVGSTGQQVVVTSSGAMLVSATVVASTATGQVNIVGTSSAVAPATSSGGLLVTAIASTVWTVTATAATNPWSSAPGFNMPVVSVSSGLVQISGTATILSASSGQVGMLYNVGTSVPELSTGLQLVTASTAGRMRTQPTLVTSTDGIVGVTTAYVPVMTVTTSGGSITVSTSFGSMAQLTTGKIVPVLQASSGVTVIDQWLGSTEPYIGQKTMANSLPVAIASNQSNLTVVSASSGLVQISGTVTAASSGLQAVVLSTSATTGGVSAKYVTITSSGLKTLSTTASIIYNIVPFATESSGTPKTIYLQVFPQTCSGPTLGTTTPVMVIPVPTIRATGASVQQQSPIAIDFDPHGIVSSTGWSAAGTTTTTGSTVSSDNIYVNLILSGT